jgi:hypothetical protein
MGLPVTHPSTSRRHRKKANEPPLRPGRKPLGAVAKVTCSLSLDPAARARLETRAKALCASMSALVEAWAMTLPEP